MCVRRNVIGTSEKLGGGGGGLIPQTLECIGMGLSQDKRRGTFVNEDSRCSVALARGSMTETPARTKVNRMHCVMAPWSSVVSTSNDGPESITTALNLVLVAENGGKMHGGE